MTDKIEKREYQKIERYYDVKNEITELTIKCRYGVFKTIFDTCFLDEIKNYKWTIKPSKKIYYVWTKHKNKSTFLHRLIAETPTGLYTDHINRKTLDNRKENLRICTLSENNQNRILPQTNPTGYVGIQKRKNKWRANIWLGKKNIYIGTFNTMLEAYTARTTEFEKLKAG